MNIDCMTAQRIVDQLGKWLVGDIWVVNHLEQIVASTQSGCNQAALADSEPIYLSQIQELIDHLDIPLHNANQEVGRLIINQATQHDKSALQAAQTLAEMIIHQRYVFEQMFDRQWALDRFIYDLLHGHYLHDQQTALEQAMLMRIDLNLPRFVSMIALSPSPLAMHSPFADNRHLGKLDQNDRQRRRYLVDLTNRYLGDSNSHICSLFDEQHLIILFAADGDQGLCSPAPIKSQLQPLLYELERLSAEQPSAGIGSYAADWQALAQSYHDANFALETGRALRGSGNIYTAADLGLAGFVCSNSSAIKSDLADHLLQSLFDQPELLQTLDVFLDADLSVGDAAQRLHLHRHGLSYRLKKIQELTGLDPASFRDATQLDAALQWYRLAQAARMA